MYCESLAVVLAAGKGTRLNLEGVPKPMAEVGGKPVIGYGLEALHKMAFSEDNLVVVAGHCKEPLVDYCGGDVQIREQETLDGNLGALEVALEGRNLERILSVLVVQADDCLGMRSEALGKMLRFHERRGADVTLLTINQFDPSAHRKDYSIIDGKVVSINKLRGLFGKRNFLAGAFCFSGSFLNKHLGNVAQENSDGKEKKISKLFEIAMSERCNISAFQSDEPWISINTPGQLAKARIII